MRREDLDEPWKIENIRRSILMLSPGAPGLFREDAVLLLELLAEQQGNRYRRAVDAEDRERLVGARMALSNASQALATLPDSDPEQKLSLALVLLGHVDRILDDWELPGSNR